MDDSNRIQRTKLAPPPPELPIAGKADPAEISFIGRTNYVAALEEKRFVFGLKRSDRRRHLYIIGKSGTGKSKLLELLIRQDVAYGHGACLLDPHGETINAILDFIPEERIGDVVVIDPSEEGSPVLFNPLADVPAAFRHQFAQSMIEVMARQFGSNWTPRLEHMLRFTLLALLEHPGATLRGMISMLTDSAYRAEVLGSVKDEMVKRFWEADFADWSAKFDTDAIVPLLNRLGQFFADPALREIFDQRENRISLEKLIAGKKLVFVNLAKGKIGDQNAALFGGILIAKLKQAGMARVRLPEAERSDFYLYIDEFQNLATETFESMLSDARKYGLNITLAHQFAGQLLPSTQASVLGSVGSIVVFRVGGDDAQRLKPEMAPVFDVRDMANLGVGEFYIRMTIDGEPYDPFSAATLKVLPPPHRSFRKEILASVQQAYGTKGSRPEA